MPEFKPSVGEQEAMAAYLVTAVVSAGEGPADGDCCVGEPPSARYYLATLAPQDVDFGGRRVRRGRQTPSSSGYELEVTDPRAFLRVRAEARCYYSVLPTLEQQLEYTAEPNRDRLLAGEYRLAPVFRGVDIDTGPIDVVLDPGVPVQYVGREQLRDEIRRVRAVAAADPRVDRRADDRRDRIVPGAAMASDTEFEQWLAGHVTGTTVDPEWRAVLLVTARPVAGGRTRVTVLLNNLSLEPTVPRQRGGVRRDDARDHHLFRVRVHVESDAGVIVPITMDLGADAYRYDGDLAAYAVNCGVECASTPTSVHLTSVAAPVFQTSRAPSADHPSTRFSNLAADPLKWLTQLTADLRAYGSSPAWAPDGRAAELAERKEADRRAFDLEVRRFEDGVSWLKRDPRLLLAFRLANRAMLKADQLSGRSRPGWRLFQLVFIVSQLSALAWREHPPETFTPGLWGDDEAVDPTECATVLWYPTGGGKTEAYLGLIVCNLFYDRARGKRRGVTAWCRFPLRLLSLQQTQRQLEMIVAADEVRVEEESVEQLQAVGGDPGERFSLGFYVGEGNTPNSLSRDPKFVPMLISDGKRRREYRVAEDCPYCRAPAVEVLPPDPSTLRLVHGCTECGRELPLYVVDTEVYRYLPSLLVGTLDKLAMIGLSDKFGAILGDVDCECAVHGLGRGGKCHERRAKGHPADSIHPLPTPVYDASPTLEIVDELHMVDEELGAFCGHYEGALAEQQRRLSTRTRPDGRGVRTKVIATTATIKGEDRQCDHLFGLRSVVVPLPGPTLDESFYWRLDTQQPLRRFVGVMPHGAGAEMTVVRIQTELHSAIRRLQDGSADMVPGLEEMSAADFTRLVGLYRKVVTYVTSLVDHGKVRRSLDTQVNKMLSDRGLDAVHVKELSGDSDFDHLKDVFKDLEDPEGQVEHVVVTSMFSHGVDVDRLNVMIFNGMPKSMAEYIQASSRIGRAYLGVVFMIFSAVRERDRSHFRYHGKFHEYLDRMVEPVAINRWSRYAARKTLPGVFMGHILQAVNREYWDAGGAPGHLHELGRMQLALRPVDAGGLPGAALPELHDAMTRTYNSDVAEADEIRPEIHERVDRAVRNIRSAGAAAGAATGGRMTYRATGDHLGLEYEPMTSLRDVAAGLPFFTVAERRRS